MILVIKAPGEEQYEMPLGEHPLTIGRSPDMDINVNDPNISRRHCEVAMRDGVCTVRDLKSRNGTYVNGEKIDTYNVNGGDVIKIGSTAIFIHEATKGPSTMMREIQHEMDDGGKGYGTILREIVKDADE
jgi:pSer/pThr/pTyr-binding forkhead associated (FHA) protein